MNDRIKATIINIITDIMTIPRAPNHPTSKTSLKTSKRPMKANIMPMSEARGPINTANPIVNIANTVANTIIPTNVATIALIKLS